MGKHAVEHDADPHLPRHLAQMREVLVRAEDRVDAHVVGGVVTVIGARLDDGVEIEAADPQLLEIGQLLLDAAQRPAVKIVGDIVLLEGPRLPADRLLQAPVQLRGLTERGVIGDAALRGPVVGEGEAIREDLIYDRAPKPRGRLKILPIDRQTEAVCLISVQSPLVAAPVGTQPVRAAPGLDAKAIPVCGRLFRRGDRDREAVLGGDHGVFLLQLVAVEDQKSALCPAGDHVQRERQLLPFPYGAERPAACCAPGVMRGHERAAAAAQDADHMGGAGLEAVHLRQIHAGCAQIAAAACRELVGVLHGKAAVVHQQAHQLWRGQRIVRIEEAFRERVQLDPALDTGTGGRVYRRSRLKILSDQSRTVRLPEDLHHHGVPVHRGPALPVPRGRNGAAVVIDNGERIVLRPVFLIAAAEPDGIGPRARTFPDAWRR